nr:helicase-related protein [Halomonas aquamarina]
MRDVVHSVKNHANCLLLTERRDHAETLARLLEAESISSVVLRGGMRVRERQTAESQLYKAQVIVATGKYIGEGFDLPRLDVSLPMLERMFRKREKGYKAMGYQFAHSWPKTRLL